MSISTTPTYNLKAVIQETGIAADTLRAWERRYGLPMPGRTPGGHRLYSKRDIEIIKWLISKQGEGLSISRAVDLWNELIEAGQDPLPTPIQEVVSLTSANLDAVRKAWLEACLVFDESTAEQVLNQAFATHPLETVCIEVLQRGLHEMGEMWYRNEATVQQEHFTSALAQRRLDALIAAAPAPTRPYSVLIGCTPGEQHVFVPLLLTLLLRRRGLKVIYLGANVPVQRFNETLQSVKPHLVVLSAQQLQTANALREAAAYLNANGGRVSYGGRIFNLIPELRKRIPAHFLGKSLQEAIQSVETLLTSDIQIEGIEAVHEDEKQLSLSFNRHRPMIDMYALTETNKIGMSIEFSTIAVQQLGNNMRSALSMGNIEAINQEMDWIEGMLHEYNQDGESLNNFLSAYAKSVDSAMGNDGKPISSWLRAQINGN
ncbi:MAG: B12-binding domain-containing protein [Anaerolineales bacterium]|jgi:DNA-binding transcriptional MerR regulator